MAIDWRALEQALIEADAALQTNEPLPAAPAFSMEQAAAALAKAEPEIDRINGVLQANPGVIRALDILLTALAAQDIGWAAPFKTVVDALPGGFATASARLPTAIWFMTTFAPDPAPLPGMGPRIGRG